MRFMHLAVQMVGFNSTLLHLKKRLYIIIKTICAMISIANETYIQIVNYLDLWIQLNFTLNNEISFSRKLVNIVNL